VVAAFVSIDEASAASNVGFPRTAVGNVSTEAGEPRPKRVVFLDPTARWGQVFEFVRVAQSNSRVLVAAILDDDLGPRPT
jgi:hypothetical protein